MRRLMEWLYRTLLGLETRPAGDLSALEAERETLLAGREAIEQALLINRDRIDALIERVIPVATAHDHSQTITVSGIDVASDRLTVTICNYPYCNCPFGTAIDDPNWCARGLPHAPKVIV